MIPCFVHTNWCSCMLLNQMNDIGFLQSCFFQQIRRWVYLLLILSPKIKLVHLLFQLSLNTWESLLQMSSLRFSTCPPQCSNFKSHFPVLYFYTLCHACVEWWLWLCVCNGRNFFPKWLNKKSHSLWHLGVFLLFYFIFFSQVGSGSSWIC